MKRSTRKQDEDRGAVTVEMVLAMPILIMLIFGVVILGNALSVKTQTVGTARDGARAASLRLPLPANTAIVSAACPDPTDATKYVTVAATKPLTLRTIPFFPTMLPAQLTETVTMRCGG